jgi:hypothetical protein
VEVEALHRADPSFKGIIICEVIPNRNRLQDLILKTDAAAAADD